MSQIQWVVFDLGGVLIDWNPRYAYRRLDADDEKIEIFLRDVATSAWNSQMDAGTLFQAAIDQRILEHPEWKDWLQLWRYDWPTMLRGPINDAVDVFESVVSKRESGSLKGLYALSNWEANTIKIARARFGFLSRFDAKLISGEEKLIKPDPRFFSLLESRFGVDPKKTLFIDDLQSNTKVAESLGFQTHVFKNATLLQNELRRLGVL